MSLWVQKTKSCNVQNDRSRKLAAFGAKERRSTPFLSTKVMWGNPYSSKAVCTLRKHDIRVK